MIPNFSMLFTFLTAQKLAVAPPMVQEQQEPMITASGKGIKSRNAALFDIQAHRGGRGNVVENTLPAFAWALINGATTLELDTGITKDDVVVVWHDEEIVAEKCQDTAPAFPNDPSFPYVSKFVANLTLAQLKTLDCGSQRQIDYPHQLTYPKTPIPTLAELFNFVSCVDTEYDVLWNIESKIDPRVGEEYRTKGVNDFVVGTQRVLMEEGRGWWKREAITFQSFDWRTLVAMKALDPSITTSVLIDSETGLPPDNSTSDWLAGLRLDSFPGPTLGEQVAQAVHSVGVDILSPGVEWESPYEFEEDFVTREMVEEARRFGMKIKPFTVNKLDVVERMVQLKVDGIITDYPDIVRKWASQHGTPVAPKYPKQRVFSCFKQHAAAAL